MTDHGIQLACTMHGSFNFIDVCLIHLYAINTIFMLVFMEIPILCFSYRLCA